MQFLTNDVVIVHLTGAVKLRFQRSPPTRRTSININVVVKHDGKWLIAAFHNCRIKPPGILQRLIQTLIKRDNKRCQFLNL